MNKIHVIARREWRAWLQANGEKEKEIWLVFYKKHTGKKSLPYDEAVEEALCFGWIDSIIKRLDEKTYARKFTPRNRGSRWSELNIARAKKMITAGLMTAAGLALIDPALLRRQPIPRPARPPEVQSIPPYIRAALKNDQQAAVFFASLAPSYRRLYVNWVDSAKREETKQRRLAEMLATLRARRKL
ncbi:MAG: YdeI/OmpD-associated family protein, partial [Candidatus Aminicenantes bacterium]|nr:YdeI/OmpD-associated family protein [Candidatus Aminicenantes bacterium]